MRLHLILKTCQRLVNVMWLRHVIGCFVLLSYSHWLGERCDLEPKNSAICEYIAPPIRANQIARITSDLKMDVTKSVTNQKEWLDHVVSNL